MHLNHNMRKLLLMIASLKASSISLWGSIESSETMFVVQSKTTFLSVQLPLKDWCSTSVQYDRIIKIIEKNTEMDLVWVNQTPSEHILASRQGLHVSLHSSDDALKSQLNATDIYDSLQQEFPSGYTLNDVREILNFRLNYQTSFPELRIFI